nr:M1 family metallopeptidase [Sphingomonadaceae bacterium]
MLKILLAGASLLAAAAHAAPGRLPANVVPIAYDITVDPDAARLRFTGNETVTIDVLRATRTITLNAADLVISSVTLDGRMGRATTDAATQTATFTFAAPVKAGRHALAIAYAGKINQSASGMFAIDYDGEHGAKERMLVTQFEAPDARRFAPTWDEPGLKATFRLSAAAPAGQTAFSNMPVAGQTELPGGKKLWHFATTPKMSSYLLFLGVGNVERKTVMAGNVEIGVITRKGVVDQGDYALASAKRILLAYNDYFGTPYPLPKLDMIAGPGSSQFFGAMENWGAIFYFERALLIDPRLATETHRQDVFDVVAHEMAHQWFGDLVTMAWWDDLWLNEGYASWMASKISNDLNPDWHALTQTLAGGRQNAYTRDARATTHPIVQHVTTVDQISQAFDDITYRKGEAVIRMLEGSVGPDAFRAGVRSYMAKHKYGNAVTDQLWTEIAAASGKPVAPMMHSYTLQGGVPMIRASEPVRAGGVTRINLTQSRFGLDAASKAPRTWIVPVALTNGGAVVRATVSGAKPVTATLPGCGLTVVNAGQSAYFRTLYAAGHFEALRRGFATLGLDDQIGVTADAYALATSGDAPVERYLGLIDTISPNASPLVWNLVASELAAIDRTLTDAPEQAAFRARAGRLLAPVFARTGWEAKPGENPAVAQLREDIIPIVGRFGDAAVTAQAVRYTMRSFDNADAVPGAIRLPALDVFGRNATPAQWDMLHAKARAEASPVTKLIYYRHLGAVADPVLAQKALNLTLTDEVPVPMRGNVIQEVAANHPALAFDWAVAHEAQVNAFLESSTRSSFIASLPGGASDPAVAARL